MRYSDKNIALDSMNEFTVRERLPGIAHMGLFFLAVLVFVCGAFVISKGSLATFAAISTLLLGGTFAAVVWLLQVARDDLLIAEFQNTLYSSSLSMNNLMSLIVRNDGMLAHVDNGFRSIFPTFDRSHHRTLQDVFAVAQISREDAEKIYKLIESSTAGQQVITVQNSEGSARRIMLSTEPLRRPRDYALIRGRVYVEDRHA